MSTKHILRRHSHNQQLGGDNGVFLQEAIAQPLTPGQVLLCTEKIVRDCKIGCCDLWLLSANTGTDEYKILEEPLSREERIRANRFRFETDRILFIIARGGLRRILSSYCSTSPGRLTFQLKSHGKPRLLVPSAALEFNVSHSGNYVLIGVTASIECGVDIEGQCIGLDEVAIANRFFSFREVDWLKRTQNGFLRLWVIKEAILKALGCGLLMPLSDIDVTDVVERGMSLVTLRGPDKEIQNLWIDELSLAPNFAAALATVNEKCLIHLMPT